MEILFLLLKLVFWEDELCCFFIIFFRFVFSLFNKFCSFGLKFWFYFLFFNNNGVNIFCIEWYNVFIGEESIDEIKMFWCKLLGVIVLGWSLMNIKIFFVVLFGFIWFDNLMDWLFWWVLYFVVNIGEFLLFKKVFSFLEEWILFKMLLEFWILK